MLTLLMAPIAGSRSGSSLLFFTIALVQFPAILYSDHVLAPLFWLLQKTVGTNG